MLFSDLQNCCSEETTIKAVEVVLKQDIHFFYECEHGIKDTQIDVSPVFVRHSPFSLDRPVNNKIELEDALNIITTTNYKSFYVRSGQNGGAGHFRYLYFCDNQDAWIMYSSPTNQYVFADQNGITEQAVNDLVVAYADSGSNAGAYKLYVQAITPDVARALANFIYDARVGEQGEDTAIEKLYSTETHQALYPQLLTERPKADKQPTQPSQAYSVQNILLAGTAAVALILAAALESWFLLMVAIAALTTIIVTEYLSTPTPPLMPRI